MITLNTRRIARATVSSVLALMYASTGTAALAQVATPAAPTDAQPTAVDTPAAPDAAVGDPGDIVVTARKTNENILKTPIAITALTGADLAARGVTSLTELSQFAPGLKIVSNSSGRNDRSFQQVIVRGFTPSSSIAQTTSMFIDGVPVSSATGIQTIDDPERVEILKGPQSAYFGRQTFAGAFNIVTKKPTDHLTGSLSAMAGTRNNYDVLGELSGPIFGDVLGFRASARKFAKDGSYKNQGYSGQTLGDQSTSSGTLALTFKPASNFTARALGLISKNNDGPSAQGIISAYGVRNGAGQTVLANQSNCSFNGVTRTGVAIVNPYICGVTPGLSATSPSSNAINDSFIKSFLANPKGRLLNPEDGVQGYGLRSRFYHLHLTMDWNVTDRLTLSSLTGLNRERKSQLSDLDNYYDISTPNSSTAVGAPAYFNYPYLVEYKSEDFSQEVRANYDGGPLKLTVGASYLNALQQGGGGGNNGAIVTNTPVTTSGANRARTMGAFFGIGYSPLPGLTFNFDGRYQVDHLYAYAGPAGLTLSSNVFAPAGTYAGGALLVDKKYKNFTPRAIVNYDVTPNTMVYASYSKGVNPGAFNTVFLSNPANVQALAADAGLRVVVEPEKLDNYEIGLKGKLFDNKVRYAFSAYYGIWDNQINAQTLAVTDPATRLVYVIQATSNTGKVRVKGIEGQVDAYVTPRFMLNLSGAVNDTEILKLSAPTVTQLTGITDFRGKENPFTSKFSGSASAQYTVPVASFDGDAFGRVDFTYKSGVWSDAANILRTPDMTQVNVRAGLRRGDFSIEAFVTNVLNNKAYSSVSDQYAFDSTLTHLSQNSAAVVGLRELRTAGVRTSISF
jgi:iron complex outermembrane receptor protein